MMAVSELCLQVEIVKTIYQLHMAHSAIKLNYTLNYIIPLFCLYQDCFVFCINSGNITSNKLF